MKNVGNGEYLYATYIVYTLRTRSQARHLYRFHSFIYTYTYLEYVY